jgi:hypothetical protein
MAAARRSAPDLSHPAQVGEPGVKAGDRITLNTLVWCEETAMRVHVESVFDCPVERVWETVQTSALLLDVIWPLFRLESTDAEGFPKRWPVGRPLQCRMYLFGFIPLGTHTLVIERIDQSARQIQSREHDPLVRLWDHRVEVKPTEDGRTLYSDDIQIESGLLTLPVWLFASVFYRHRQGRWRKLARRLATVPATSAW